MNVREFLRDRAITFDALDHAPTFSAQSLAATVHVHGAEVAKTVLLWTEDDYVLAVLPATRTVDLERVQVVLGGDALVELASEQDCGERFSDCELGALPPFGSRYGMSTLIDESLLQDEVIVFEGNSHDDAIRMKCRDFLELERPIIGRFTYMY
jgi:Ala-tRNA(Pro) deacylase